MDHPIGETGPGLADDSPLLALQISKHQASFGPTSLAFHPEIAQQP